MTELRDAVARAVRKACTAYTMETPRQWEIAADAAIAIVIERAAKVAGSGVAWGLAISQAMHGNDHTYSTEKVRDILNAVASDIRNLAPETTP